MEHQATIFVSIASYRDSELIPTLKDMFRHATYPEKLHIAVCWQDNENYEIFEQAGFVLQHYSKISGREVATYSVKRARVDIITVHYFASQGASWARSLAEAFFEDEDYFLQIDSHSRFIPGWDEEMIAMLRDLQTHSPNPIISAYPPGYTPGLGEEESKEHRCARLIFREYDSKGIPMLSSKSFEATMPVRGNYLAGGFIFAQGHFVKIVPNDPHIFFAGEEIAMAVRAFTHGYDVYHPHKPLLWHFYRRHEHSKVWGDHSNEAKVQGNVEKAWWERDQVAKKRVRTLLALESDSADNLEPYTLGQKRTLREFEYQAGICLHKGTVLPDVVGSEKVNYFPLPPHSDEEWLERQYAWFSKSVTLNLSDYIVDENPVDKLQLSVYTAKNRLLYKRILSPEELTTFAGKSSNVGVSLQVEFKTASMVDHPEVVRICPWSDVTGWGTLTETAW